MAMGLPIKAMIVILFALAALLTVPVLIGVYVYRDSRCRGMSPVLWTLIAVAAPALIGFIIYLLIRGSYPDLRCPQCAEPVTEQYTVCPHCGAKLRPACPNCSFPVGPDWKVCPKCAAPLDRAEIHHTPPLRQRDRTLGKILIAIIVIPIALVALTVFSLATFQTSTAGPSFLQTIRFDEYLRLQESEQVRTDVAGWLNSWDRSDRAYVLRYDHSTELDAGCDYFYLVHVPGAGDNWNRFGTSSSLFGDALELSLKSSGENGVLFCMQTHADKPPALRITLDGRRIHCDVQVVDYNPTLFFIEPNYAQAEPGSVELPERLLVVKFVGGERIGAADDGTAIAGAAENAGVVEVTDEDLMLKILACIDSGERVPMDQIPEFHFRDGFEIIVEYQIHDEYLMHDDMTWYMVLMEDGVCYLDDNRVRNTAHGSSFRIMDEDFYDLLEDLFR